MIYNIFLRTCKILGHFNFSLIVIKNLKTYIDVDNILHVDILTN